MVYTRSNNRVVEIAYKPEDFRNLARVVREMLAVVRHGHLPRRAAPSRSPTAATDVFASNHRLAINPLT